MTLTFYHKPTCSKSRETKKLLDETGASYDTVLYIEKPPSLSELQKLAKILDGDVKDMLRPKEAKEAGWTGGDDPDAILQFIAKHPETMQRPIVTDGKTAVIGRPIENVRKLL